MRLPAKTPHLMSLLNFSQCDHPIHQILWFWLCIHIKLNFLPEINFPTKKFHVLEHLRQCDTSNYKPYGGSRLVLLVAIYTCLNKRVHQNRHEWSLFNIKRLIKPTTCCCSFLQYVCRAYLMAVRIYRWENVAETQYPVKSWFSTKIVHWFGTLQSIFSW